VASVAGEDDDEEGGTEGLGTSLFVLGGATVWRGASGGVVGGTAITV